MPKPNRKFGNWGEELAASFLRKRNYEIVEMNFQKQCGEIDIIARKDETLHFIEVKTRTEKSVQVYGLPQEAIGKSKQKKIFETASAYLAERSYPENINWQIDVVSIVYSQVRNKAKISLISNAFDESSILT